MDQDQRQELGQAQRQELGQAQLAQRPAQRQGLSHTCGFALAEGIRQNLGIS